MFRHRCIISDCSMVRDGVGHHVKSRGAGGDNSSGNIVSLCRRHHQMIHAVGRTAFANAYPDFKKWLESNGWELCKMTNRYYRSVKDE